ncbi:hypothetical protein [Oricola indica]|uniref:hypothetical protein n=1 Tax=Oricola indica TaxID=2872591 RepID=UPI003CCBDCDD
MSRDPTFISALKQLSRERQSIGDVFTKFDYIKKTEDRPAAIIAATDLEDGLRDLLAAQMVALNKTETDEMFTGERLLGSFSAKTQMAYALGLIGKNTRRDLDIIRLIRNAFAHSRKVIFFDTPEISDACAQITLPERFPDPSRWEGVDQPMNTPRRRFLGTISLYTIAIIEAQFPHFADQENPLSGIPLD